MKEKWVSNQLLPFKHYVINLTATTRQCAIQRVEMQFKDKRDRGYDPKDKRVVMTMDDLSAAMQAREGGGGDEDRDGVTFLMWFMKSSPHLRG